MQVPYGVVEMNNHRLTALREKPIQRFFINAGIYVLHPSVLQLVRARHIYGHDGPRATTAGSQGSGRHVSDSRVLERYRHDRRIFSAHREK